MPSPATISAEAPRLRTVGYEGAGIARFLATLAAAGIEVLIDVRARPWSRNPDFVKAKLEGHVTAAGMGYRHLELLGNPDALRAAARAGDGDAFPAGYLRHLETPAARRASERVVELAREHAVALMCMEADPARCHRSLLAGWLAEKFGFRVAHLHCDGQAAFDF